jgi:SAM-dependent methyltransferase
MTVSPQTGRPESVNVVFKSKPIDVGMAEAYFELATPSHFWCKRRFEVFQKLAEDSLVKGKSVAEFGCGNGVVQWQIEKTYGVPVWGCDLNETALRRSIAPSGPIYYYNIHDRCDEYAARFDVIFLFDVLEHIDKEDQFLDSVKFHLKKGGHLAINVPAQQWLYSAYDKVQGHCRRYSLASLSDVALRNGFNIDAITYWGAPLVPVALARKVMLGNRKLEASKYQQGFDPRTPLLNRALRGLSQMEMLPQSVVGTSVMAILASRP